MLIIRSLLIVFLLAAPVSAGIDFQYNNSDYLNCGTTNLPTNFPVSIYAVVDSSTFENSESQIVFGWSDYSHGFMYVALGYMGDVSNELRARFAVRSGGGTGFADGDTDVSSYGRTVLIGVGGSTTDRRIYVNGSLDGDNTSSVIYPTGLDRTAIGLFCRNSACSTDDSGGIVYEVAIWDSELSANDIAILSNSSGKRMALQVQPANLQGYWVLDEGKDGEDFSTTADFYKDISGNANHCQGFDAPTTGNTDNASERFLSYP